MKIQYSDAPLGAEISEIDLARPVDNATFAEIEDLFHDRGVIVFRDQRLTDEQQIEFSKRFGELEIHPAKIYNKPEHGQASYGISLCNVSKSFEEVLT